MKKILDAIKEALNEIRKNAQLDAETIVELAIKTECM